MSIPSSRAERVMSAMVWLNLASAVGAFVVAGILSWKAYDAGQAQFQQMALIAMSVVWGVAFGTGVWRYFRRPTRGSAREIALMASLLFGGFLVGGVLRTIILGRRGGPSPIALGLVLLALAAIWVLYRFFLRRAADSLYPEE